MYNSKGITVDLAGITYYEIVEALHKAGIAEPTDEQIVALVHLVKAGAQKGAQEALETWVQNQPKKWRRYRFSTKQVKDYRPLLFNPAYPWWKSGVSGDGSMVQIVAYLPAHELLATYWDDAFNVTYREEASITFTDRFPKPAYYREKE